MAHRAYEDQTEHLAVSMAHWLELFDEELSQIDKPIPQRPLSALIKLLVYDAVELRAGEEKIDVSDPLAHVGQLWFRALYTAVERWYVNNYGAKAVKGSGRSHLDGAVLIRGAAYGLRVPDNRNRVEVEGELAWIYFDEDIGEGEDPADWIVDGPDLRKLPDDQLADLQTQLTKVASTLRYVEFRRVTARGDGDEEVRRLVLATLSYLQQAARRMVQARQEERLATWSDLQLANESALKAVLQLKTGTYPYIHDLPELLEACRPHGVVFDQGHIERWPKFREVSGYRYLLGAAGTRARLHEAYLLTLDLVRAGMALIQPGMKPGFGLLLRYPPWMSDAKLPQPNTAAVPPSKPVRPVKTSRKRAVD